MFLGSVVAPTGGIHVHNYVVVEKLYFEAPWLPPTGGIHFQKPNFIPGINYSLGWT